MKRFALAAFLFLALGVVAYESFVSHGKAVQVTEDGTQPPPNFP